jgi:hypothetical protein
MNRVFRIGQGIVVPDGTTVYPFLNAKDSTSDLPYDLLDGFSLAAGRIAPRMTSKIHVFPFVTQVTWVVSGHLDIRMKDGEHDQPYTVRLAPQEAVLTKGGTFFQLINTTADLVDVLYVASPPYLFFADEKGAVVYDDAFVFDRSWEEMAGQRWAPPEMPNLDAWRAARERAAAAVAARKSGNAPRSLAETAR